MNSQKVPATTSHFQIMYDYSHNKISTSSFHNIKQNHVKEAEDVLNTIRDIPGSKAEGSYWDYSDFLEELEAQFK